MKKLLPLLLCYILMVSQASAVSGGPVFGGNGRVNTIGSYSGVIRGVTETNNDAATTTGAPPIPGDTLPPVTTPGTLPANTVASNALGLFDLVVPGTGTATGAFLLFADGRVFTGTIDASVDPTSAQLSGLLNSVFSISTTSSSVSTTTGTITSSTSTVSATAVGSISAKIIGTSFINSATLARISGTSFLQINFGTLNTDNSPVIDRVLTFTVNGFKQTAATFGTAVSSFATNPSGQNGAGGSGGGTAGGSGGG